MNDGTLVRKNLFRKGLRTTLLIFSIFIAFLIFGVLGTFDYNFNYRQSPNGADRLLAVNKINFTQPLPFAYLNRIRGVEGVRAATMMNWFGGYYQDARNQVQTFSVEPQSFRQIYGDDLVLTPAQWEAFEHDRTAIIIGEDTAKRYGFRVGQRVPMRSDIYTNRATGQQAWDFNIVGIFHAAKSENPASGAYFNYEYFRESATFGNDNIGMVALRTASVSQNDRIAQRIDAMFANSPAETRTQDELAFGRSFLAQLGNIALIITLVVSAAFAAILMVVGNTMVMNVRERTKEIGVMKTLGFSSGRVVRLILGEALLLCVSGALLGLGAAALLLMAINPALKESFGSVTMGWEVATVGLTIAIVFSLIVGLVPALNAFNLKIVDALSRK